MQPKIQIQVKDKKHSKSFTIEGTTVNNAYPKIKFLFDELLQSKKPQVTIRFSRDEDEDVPQCPTRIVERKFRDDSKFREKLNEILENE